MSKNSNQSGTCYLVGAGPGDVGLVTLKARDLIQQAEVIVYDALCNPLLLQWAPKTAKIIYAGKRSGAHALSQEQINTLLVESTKTHCVVVRLKGGDPFLFGRGSEEALALVAAKLPFEVVPGVTSALAAPAYAGIPATHRGVSNQVTIFTGHEGTDATSEQLHFEQLAKLSGTRIMLMGMERLESVTQVFLSNGAPPTLPVAIVRWGTTGKQQTLTGKLDTIVAQARAAELESPAVVVFGEVVKLQKELAWFDKRPLLGKRIVVTRTRKQAGALSGRLSALGADVLELPTIRIEPPKDERAFAELVRDCHMYEWIIFTSPNGVTAFFDMFFRMYDDARDLGPARIAAIGPATAAKVKSYHLKVDIQPETAVAESLVDAIEKDGSVDNLKFLLVRPEEARDVIASALSKKGAIVDEAFAYRTVPETAAEDHTGAIARFKEEGADMITFASSSAVENFMALNLPRSTQLKTASLGPITSKTMRDLHLTVDVEAKEANLESLTEAIVQYYTGQV